MIRTRGAIVSGLSLALLSGCAAKPADAAPAAQVSAAPVTAAPAAAQPAAAQPAPAPVAAASNGDQVVAVVGNRSITMDQLMAPLIESHGLTVLLNLVQLEFAKQAAEHDHITVTDADFVEERKQTMDRLFAEADQKTQDKIDDAVAKNKPEEAAKLRDAMERDHVQLFDQFLQNQKVTKPEFDIVLKTNTYLRKIAEPKVIDSLTDEQLHKAFDAQYGASVRIRHIQGNPQELARALERIKAGEPFESVAKQMSRNKQTAPLGGELPRFSLATPGLPENFKRAAFELQVGEVSPNMVEADGSFHLIKLEEKFSPKAVKYESVKEIIKQSMREQTVQLAVKKFRDQLAVAARTQLKVEEPIMKAQFAARLAERDKQIKDQQDVKKQLEKERADEELRRTNLPAPVSPDARELPRHLPGDPEAPANAPAPAGPPKPAVPNVIDPAAPPAPVAPPAPAANDPAQATEPAQGPVPAPAAK